MAVAIYGAVASPNVTQSMPSRRAWDGIGNWRDTRCRLTAKNGNEGSWDVRIREQPATYKAYTNYTPQYQFWIIMRRVIQLAAITLALFTVWQAKNSSFYNIMDT